MFFVEAVISYGVELASDKSGEEVEGQVFEQVYVQSVIDASTATNYENWYVISIPPLT